METKLNPVCRVCGVELTDENWAPGKRKSRHYICKNCYNEEERQWRKANPERARAHSERSNRKQGMRPFYENRECPSYLGVYVAERVLSHVFKNVERMPYGNSGYDFICGQGYMIDIKGSCLRKNNRWEFGIHHNTKADYFLCLAFDNRGDLNPLHVWLIPGGVINHLVSASIGQSTIHKWDAYKLDIDKVTACCNVMKETQRNF